MNRGDGRGHCPPALRGYFALYLFFSTQLHGRGIDKD